MPRYRQQFSVLESKWGLNKRTNEVVGVRLLYFDPQMYNSFMIELLRGDLETEKMHYAIAAERATNMHMAYEFYETISGSFLTDLIPLKPKDHPFIARFIREKETEANKYRRYAPGSDWRYKYGMPPVIFSGSFLRYFNQSPFMSFIGWGLLIFASKFGIAVIL